jgi:signal transduction histidine kinase
LLKDVSAGNNSSAVQKGLFLRVSAPANAYLHTDRLKLERILNNLVANAVKFTDHGGVRIVAECASGALEVHVIDTGLGLSADQQARLFQEFYQVQNHARDPRKGFGLGLSIARRLARQLGGEIEVESTAGKGSRFSVLLPGIVLGEPATAGSDVAVAGTRLARAGSGGVAAAKLDA